MDSSGSFLENKIWNLNIHINLASFTAIYTFGVFNSCQPNVSSSLQWGPNEDLYITLFSAFIPIGSLIGSIFANLFLNKLGRRGTIMWIDAAYIGGSAIIVIPSTIAFGIGRLITGFCGGMFMTVAPVFLGEVTPEPMMSRIGPLIVILENFGLIFCFGAALALPTQNFENDPFNHWWLFLFLFPAFVCLYQLCYFKFFYKNDTPQYYLSKGMKNKASVAIEATYQNEGIERALRRVNSEAQSKFGKDDKIGIKELFTQKRFRKMLRDGNILCVLNQMSGFEIMILYSSIIFGNLGGGVFFSRLMTFLIGIVSLISNMISFKIIWTEENINCSPFTLVYCPVLIRCSY